MDRKTQEGFPRNYRIVRGSQYRSIYDSGAKVHAERFVLFGARNSLNHHRLGITVSRRIGSAVVRNRIKRLFREIFRRSAADIPHSIDFVVNARRGAGEAGYRELREEFLGAVDRVRRLLGRT